MNFSFSRVTDRLQQGFQVIVTGALTPYFYLTNQKPANIVRDARKKAKKWFGKN